MKLKPLYVSLSVSNNEVENGGAAYDVAITPDTSIMAEVSMNFNSPIIDKASDYLVCVERLCISTNGIPFYDGQEQPYENVELYSKQSLTSNLYQVPTSYSLTELLSNLNDIAWINPQGNVAVNMSFSITSDGYIYISTNGVNWNLMELRFPRRLNKILGISTAQMIDGQDYCYSLFPRIDAGDDLDHIMLRTNLPTHTDAIGNSRQSILTDFAPPSQYSNSLSYEDDLKMTSTGFTSNIRQKMIYNPNERRFLELIGDFPIQDIVVEVFYMNTDDVLKRVVLPFGCVFEIKLGFYRKD